MKRTALFAALALLTSFVYGQPKTSGEHIVYGGIGANLFFGDLGGGSSTAKHTFGDINIQSLRPAITVGYEYKPYKQLSGRFGIMYSKVGADDANSKEESRRDRNLNFRSNIFAVGASIDYYLKAEKNVSNGSKISPQDRISVYFTTGLSMFKFNPQGSLDGVWYDLQPLCTEGQGTNVSYTQYLDSSIPHVYTTDKEPYKLTAFEIPVGFGLNVAVNRNISLGLQIAFHFTTTDYIDDCSNYYFDWKKYYADEGKELPGDIELKCKMADKRLSNKGIKTGEKRGNSGYNDAYTTALIILRYKLMGGGRKR